MAKAGGAIKPKEKNKTIIPAKAVKKVGNDSAAAVKAKKTAKPASKIKPVKVNIIQPFIKKEPPKEAAAEKKPVLPALSAVAKSIPAPAASFNPPFMPPVAKKETVAKKAIQEQKPISAAPTFIATGTKKEQKSLPTPRSVGLYRKIAFSFIFLTVALLAIIFYFSFVKVSIVLIPNQERVSSNLIIDIYDQDNGAAAGEGAVAGVVKKIEVSETRSYTASGSEILGEEAVGKAVIVNNYNKNQPLVATTRLLSADNKLFRIKDTVNVPAGGTAEVEIYADKPGPDMAIGPTKFTIPGLWAGLQDKIYAENREPIKYQQKVKRNITQADIDAAVADLKQVLLARAKDDIEAVYQGGGKKLLYGIDENSAETDIDGKVGEEKEKFSVTMKTTAAVVAFNDEAIKKMARAKIAAAVPDDKELAEFNEENIAYSLSNYNLEQGTATVNAVFEGKMALKADSSVIDKNILVGLTREQLNDYLSGLPEIAGFDIKFSPSFINKVPNLVDRIEIEIHPGK
ncbi:hypothetical protein HY798_01555 [Candidatus Falkowbacteria bacterium]|nr:hypothetical protein [Candidatus Falkowbacteria bacterium]